MEIIKTYRYKLRLNKHQEEKFSQWLGVCRLIYNLAKEVSEETYKKTGVCLSAFDLQSQVIQLKQDYEWMRDLPKDTLVEPAFRFRKSLDMFFRCNGYPKWAKKDEYNSLVFIQQNENALRIEGNKMRLQKIGWIKFHNSRSIPGIIKQIIIKKKYNGWYASVVFMCDKHHLAKNENNIGIDLGITHLAITSDGEFIENPRALSRHEKQLRIENRSLSRKKKGSNNRKKQLYKVQKLYAKIKNTRKDYLHKVSTKLVRENQSISMEDLQVLNMVKNRKLSKSISDASWGILREYIKYKCKWFGREFILVPPQYTSMTCSGCGERREKIPLRIRSWECENCGEVHHRDINAAKNIKRAGQALSSLT